MCWVVSLDSRTVIGGWGHVNTRGRTAKQLTVVGNTSKRVITVKKQILAAEMAENEHYWFKNVWRKQERAW